MSTINPNLPNIAAGQTYPELGRSLVKLSTRAKPADIADLSDSDESSAGAGPADMVQEIARQNGFSALADSDAAASANQTAAGLISSQPAAAFAAQANLSSGSVLGLLENDSA
jgi:hypothetical protein